MNMLATKKEKERQEGTRATPQYKGMVKEDMQASQGGREEERKADLKKKLMGKPEMTAGQ